MSLNDRDDAVVVDSLPVSWERYAAVRSREEEPRRDRAAIYARFSTMGQKETSVERQVELSREYAERTQRTVVDVFVDRGQSSMTACREGLEAMMEAAARREFGALVVENVDRLARDLSILSTVFRKLEALGIEMHDPSRGRLAITDIAIQGLMGETGRRLLLDRTRFARTQMAREGRIPWGRCFGYGRITGMPGQLAIDEAQAATVRLVFRLYREGLNPPGIVKVLNERAIASPQRARGWTETSIRILLNNPLY